MDIQQCAQRARKLLLIDNVMANIIIHNLADKSVPVVAPDKPLLHQFQAIRLDWMHACGGKGRCTTCKVLVLEGLENLSATTEAERRFVRLGALRDHERLACQACAQGDVRIAVPDENKLPHLTYSH